jgi:ABC-type multidrug transport system ATPase subunit
MITVQGLDKSFGKQHILQNISCQFPYGSKTVILGANGSGKSTLIKILSGAQEASENPPLYDLQGTAIPPTEAGLICSIAAPYVALNPMFSLKETLDFHQKMVGFQPTFDANQWIEQAGLEPHLHKRIDTFSSGMKQRVRLLLAIASDRPLLLLDEPTSNLDKQGLSFYQNLISAFTSEKTVIVASNYQQAEYEFCTAEITLDKHY